jgi:hypothetical protein
MLCWGRGGFLMRLSVFLCSILIFGCTTVQPAKKEWEVKVSKEGEVKVWVWKPDGSQQCGMAPASLTPDLARQELKKAGVMVYEARTGQDGMMHITKCGAATGKTVDVEISKKDGARALSLGYRIRS